MLVVAMLLSWSVAFAATQSPIFQKGKYYGKQIVVYALGGQMDKIDAMVKDLENYVYLHLETEDDVMTFINGIEAGMREGCAEAGLDKETTEQIVNIFYEALVEELTFE